MERQVWTRRKVLRSLAVAGAGAVALPRTFGTHVPAWADGHLPDGVSFDPDPFTIGVASGYPTPDGVILWTRVAPEPLQEDGGLTAPVDVDWVVATDPGLTSVVASGTVTAEPAWGHSVHVDVTGLSPTTTYWYRFSAPSLTGQDSRVGRTRTAPAGATNELRFAVASCQHFAHGHYAALGHIADEDIDFVVHLGDYIYEGEGNGKRNFPGPSPAVGNPDTVGEWRVRYAMYKGDPHLRDAHSQHPWILTWDDHEIRNNYKGQDPLNDWSNLMAAGYQAWYEHQPIRVGAGLPNGPSFRIYQRVIFGDLLDIAMIDTRQYNNPSLTMLGSTQKAWLKNALSTSTTSWRVIGNPKPFRIWRNSEGIYEMERREIVSHILNQGIPDVVSVAGDTHRFVFSHIKQDQDLPTSPIVLPEFNGVSLSSDHGNMNEQQQYNNDSSTRYLDDDTWGYMVCDVSQDRWRTTAWGIEHSQDPSLDPRLDPGASKILRSVFEVDRGSPLITHVDGIPGNPNPDPPL